MSILVLQHSDRCRPGRLGLTLRDHAFKLDVVRLDKGDNLPPDLDDVDGVISLGGPQNVDEGHAWLDRERELLRSAHEASLPIVGICLGHQLLAEALGGEVGPMEAPEVGFVPVDVLPSGQTDTILAGIAWRAPQFQRHRYEVKKLPAGAQLLASSEKCKVQVFRAGMRSYGFQYHFEADRSMIDAFMSDARTDLHQAGATTDEFARSLERHYEMFSRLADRVCISIATYLIPRVATAMNI
jgi:GMP synthase-like glutamine amidotransferase